MASSSKDIFFQTLKYGNILLTGLILAYPKKFINFVYTTCKRPAKSQHTANTQQQDQLSYLKDVVGEEIFNKFKAACKIVRKEQVSTQDSLELYGLYKQAINGPCNLPQPSSMNYEAKLKWEHWTRFKDLSQSDAMMLYVEYVVRLLPKYTDYLANITTKPGDTQEDEEEDNDISEKDLFESEDEDDDNLNQNNYQKDSGSKEKVSRGFGLTVSKMTNNLGDDFLQDKEAIDVTDETQNFFSLLEQQNIPEIEQSIKEGFNLLTKNEQGSTALHYSIENDLLDTFYTLLKSFPEINVQDSDGYTPIYIAVLNENEELILKLLEKGADPYIQDFEGQSAYDTASESIKKLIKEFEENQKHGSS